jgi:amidase
VGFKPTRGVISSEGIIQASKRLDTVGLLTRDVNDAVQILRELICQSSHHLSDRKVKSLQGIESVCSQPDMTGMRVGIPWHLNDLESIHGARLESSKKMLGTLKQAGATLVHDVYITGAEEYETLSAAEKQTILDTDMKIATNQYLSSLTVNPQNVRNLQELINFTKFCPGEGYPQRNVEGFERAQANDASSDAYLRLLARDEHFAGDGGIQGALNRHGCDILLVPTLSVILQTFAAKAGSPVLSVPVGAYPDGTPVETDVKNGLINIGPGRP